MIGPIVGIAVALLVALATLLRDRPGRVRTIRMLASMVVIGMLWILAPRANRGQPGVDEGSPVIRTDSIHWSQRVVVGDPVEVRGKVDSTRDVLIRITGPDGHLDSTTARGTFTLRSATTAAGHWAWKLEIAGTTRELGVDVRPLPSLRLLLLEGRPSFETAALVRRLASQGASVTSVTRLTANEDRIAKIGVAPPASAISPQTLSALDAIIVAPGGNNLLSPAERAMVLTEVGRGLGVLHLVDTLQPVSAWFPFATNATGIAAVKVRPIIDGTPASAPVSGAAVALSGGNPLLLADGGISLARILRHGSGAIVAMRSVGASGWTLAGEDSLAGALWSQLLGALLRPSRAEWRIDNTVHPRVDQLVVVERVGDNADEAELREVEGPVDRVTMIAVPGDSLRRRAGLWPNHPGWLALSTAGDTLWLLVEPPEPPRLGDFASPDDFSSLRWVAWLLLLAGIATMWRRR